MKSLIVGVLAILVASTATTVAWLHYWPTASWRTSVTVINRSGVALTDVDFFCRQGNDEIRRQLDILEPDQTLSIHVDPEVLSGTIGFKLGKIQHWQRIDVDFWSGEQIGLAIAKDGTLEVVVDG